jgi:hypothetical protein
MIAPMSQSTASTMLSQAVQSLARLLPGAEPEREAIHWVDIDHSWHNSSFDLASGLRVIEYFDAREAANFADTMAAFHSPQPATVLHGR